MHLALDGERPLSLKSVVGNLRKNSMSLFNFSTFYQVYKICKIHMRLKNLQALLEGFEGPPEPNIELEQYPTPARLAAEVIFDAATLRGDIEDKIIADLGCGCGILSIACLCMGAKEVHSFDIDPLSIEAAKRNLELLEFDEPPPIFFHEGNVLEIGDDIHFDTVVMNPPFGTRNKGADVEFLQVAARISSGAIYSFHKSSTRNHLLNIAAPKLGLIGELEMEVDFDLKKLYKFHKQDLKSVEVDILRFEHSNGQIPKPAPMKALTKPTRGKPSGGKGKKHK